MAINPVGSGTAAFVLRQLNLQAAAIGRATERISTGLRINRAGDDPAGISMAAKFLAQLGGITTAEANVQQGISLVQTAGGGLDAIKDAISSITDSSIEAQNGSLPAGGTELQAIAAALQQFQDSISDVVSTTTFNARQLLAGGANGTVTLQSGPQAGQTLTVTLPDLVTAGATKAARDALDTAIDTFQGSLTIADAAALQTAAGNAFTAILGEVTRMGGVESRLNANLGALSAMESGTSNALSTIRDADTAAEAVELAKQQLLQASSFAMLKQLNTQAALVLKLLE